MTAVNNKGFHSYLISFGTKEPDDEQLCNAVLMLNNNISNPGLDSITQ